MTIKLSELPTIRSDGSWFYPILTSIQATESNDGDLKDISFSKEVPDFDNGFVDFKFVVVGFGKEDIQVFLNPEEGTIEVKAKNNSKVWHKRSFSQEVREKINFDSVSSKLENAVLTVSVSTKRKQKEIEVKID